MSAESAMIAEAVALVIRALATLIHVNNLSAEDVSKELFLEVEKSKAKDPAHLPEV